MTEVWLLGKRVQLAKQKQPVSSICGENDVSANIEQVVYCTKLCECRAANRVSLLVAGGCESSSCLIWQSKNMT